MFQEIPGPEGPPGGEMGAPDASQAQQTPASEQENRALEESKTEFRDRMADELTRVFTAQRDRPNIPLDAETAAEVSQILADGLAEDSVIVINGIPQQTAPPERMGVFNISLQTADAINELGSKADEADRLGNKENATRLRMDVLKYSMNALAAHQATDAMVALSTAEGLWNKSPDRVGKTILETSPKTVAAIVKAIPKIDPANAEAGYIDVLDVIERGSPSRGGHPTRPDFRDESDRARLFETIKGLGDEKFTAFVEKRNELRKNK